jgi:hypothetical protein
MFHSIHAQESENELTATNILLPFNGIYITNRPTEMSQVNSEDSIFWCSYDIDLVTDEVRELTNIQFYQNNQLLFTISLSKPKINLEILQSIVGI